MGNFQLARRLFASPRDFFLQLADRPRYALPMWLGLLASVGLVSWYYATVDIEWFKETLLFGEGVRMNEAQRAQAAAFMTRGLLLTNSAIAGVLLTVLIRVVEAGWYKLLGRLTGLRRSFRQWFAFGWWTSLPQVIAIIPGALLLAFSPTRQIGPGAVAPLSINELFLDLPMTHPGYQLALQVSLLTVLTLGLTVFGVRVWSGRSWGFALLFGLLGPALFFGAWGAWVASIT